MKKVIAVLIVMLCIVQHGNAVPIDSTDTVFINKKVEAITNEIKAVKIAVDSTRKELIDSLKSDSTKKKYNCNPVIKEVEALDIGKWFLIFSPFILLVLVVWIVAFGLKDFKFTDALTENEPPKKIIKNPEYTSLGIAANARIPNVSLLFPPTIEISNIQPSLVDLWETVTSKETAILAAQTSLNNADKETTTLNEAVLKAKKELDDANDATPQLVQNVASADTQLKAIKDATVPGDAAAGDAVAIAAAEKKLEDEKDLVTKNTDAISSARTKWEEAKKAVEENTNAIENFKKLIPNVEKEVNDAKTNFAKAAADIKNNTADTINTYRPSISRYIALITSLVIIILVVCMSSFFIYHYIRTGCPPDFGALTIMLIALGLGVAPYVFNKVSTAITTNKS